MVGTGISAIASPTLIVTVYREHNLPARMLQCRDRAANPLLKRLDRMF